MLNRLFLVIHWIVFIAFCLFWVFLISVWIFSDKGFFSYDNLEIFLKIILWDSSSKYSNPYFTAIGLHFPVLFLLVKFIVLGKWTWFPWQRSK